MGANAIKSGETNQSTDHQRRVGWDLRSFDHDRLHLYIDTFNELAESVSVDSAKMRDRPPRLTFELTS